MAAMSVMVRAVIARAPAMVTGWSPSPWGWTPWARAHRRTTAISFRAVDRLARSKPPIWAAPSEKRLDSPSSRSVPASTP